MTALGYFMLILGGGLIGLMVSVLSQDHPAWLLGFLSIPLILFGNALT